ncbi:MAG: hypothetical protein KAW12_11295 [Candidatus Aminicenantes bacterium]|nr:hypothetical protein [Candidatus Aminicenantes bacterium]
MKKKLLVSMLALLVIVSVAAGFLSITLDAATCTPSGGIGTCEGECCKLVKDGCFAGPCSVIIKL